MLADLLEKAASESFFKCTVQQWVDDQDSRVKDVFKTSVTRGSLPNYQQFYSAIKKDALSRNEAPPFGLTSLKLHVQSKCPCSNVRK